jgi:lipopolysaccharide export LptBFGC system permease protein LptF
MTHEKQAREKITSSLGDIREKIHTVEEESKNRSEAFNQRFDKILSVVEDTRKDTLRIQLLMLMREENNNIDTILRVAETYFVKLQGDWYMTSEFYRWAKAHDVVIPDSIWESIKDHDDIKS